MKENSLLKSSIFLFLYIFNLSCSKTTFKKASPIVDDDCISISNIMVVKNMDSIWELRNEEEEHLFYFPNFEEAEKTKIVLEHYQTKFICKCGEGFYTNSIGEENPNALIMQYQLSYPQILTAHQPLLDQDHKHGQFHHQLEVQYQLYLL